MFLLVRAVYTCQSRRAPEGDRPPKYLHNRKLHLAGRFVSRSALIDSSDWHQFGGNRPLKSNSSERTILASLLLAGPS